jgi:hypothetical protein
MIRALTDWLLADLRLPKGVYGAAEHVHPWWRVMCLTGVDYFSTLGFQPGIAFLATSGLSPIATLVLVLVTLFVALPLYRRVARSSPNGIGSIAMLERLFPEWGGKIFVLVLLGFATTDFIITMTLSAADAAAHFVHNPFAPRWLTSQMLITLLLGIAVILVASYLFLNAIVTVRALFEVLHHPHLFAGWKNAVFAHHPSWLAIAGVCLLLFPRLALGLSGFETGVAVMPLISGEDLDARIRNTQKLLVTAAGVMSIFLIATSFVTTILIPSRAFAGGGEANGRALAYLAHEYLGNVFGSVYDISTIFILAFAGASAMAGLLKSDPPLPAALRYGPRMGTRRTAPCPCLHGRRLFVTIGFRANVDAQGAHTPTRWACKRFYFCPHDKGACNCRKPLPGLFQQAQAQFPDIQAETSVMIGDSLSDIEFGRNLGMTTIFIEGDPKARENRKPGAQRGSDLADKRFDTLIDAVDYLLGVTQKPASAPIQG